MTRMHQTLISLKTMVVVVGIVAGTGGAAMADNYGAIAFSKSTGGFGFAYDHLSRRDAENRAMAECRARTRGCEIAIWFKNACGSVAMGSNGWGSAWAESRRAAERAAIRNCSRHTRGCTTLAWTCTSM
ncbi:MAG: DUF4189 domain-containing protein [Hoeflea sp.]|uniref:DUF4189 domain-containing protein n=1 Tax=Hoeflea sp. TaxID=1940281 RepID=UPI002731BCC9|nr:DUF4189 domain-containing protein [Hoeflea sp.]MDP2120094.1 DUF4189 domain-containing protein [Hoeflea sp.]